MSNPDSVTPDPSAAPAPTPPAPPAPPPEDPPPSDPDAPVHEALTSPPQSPPMGVLTGPSARPDPRDVRDWYPSSTPPLNHDAYNPLVPYEPGADLPPTITPGFILGTLTAERAVEISLSPLFPQTPDEAPRVFTRADSRALARRMLAALTIDELRALARRVAMPEDGAFVDLLRRLSLLC